MTTFVIRELHNGVLVPLKDVVQRLPRVVATTWCFRHIQVHVGWPFGLTVHEFERLTRERADGYCVTDDAMRAFLEAEIQVVDGEIDAIAEDGTRLFTLENEDSSQWEIHTENPALIAAMQRRGFKMSADG